MKIILILLCKMRTCIYLLVFDDNIIEEYTRRGWGYIENVWAPLNGYTSRIVYIDDIMSEGILIHDKLFKIQYNADVELFWDYIYSLSSSEDDIAISSSSLSD